MIHKQQASYQHSIPGEGRVMQSFDTSSSSSSSVVVYSYNDDYDARHYRRRNLAWKGVVVCSCLMMFLLVLFSSEKNTSVSSLLRTNSVTMLDTTASLSSHKDTSVQPPVDWDKAKEEGKYDWQKCKESNDPDCWKNEGKRVGSYWKGIRTSIRDFWRNLFGSGSGGSGSGSGGETTSTTTARESESGEAPSKTTSHASMDEGGYDWQKCKESDDPDCWKNEGERVGTFWKAFGERIRHFFAKKDNDSDSPSAGKMNATAIVENINATDIAGKVTEVVKNITDSVEKAARSQG